MTRTDHPHDQLQLLLDGRLDPDERERVQAHVNACAQCRRELEALRWTKGTAGGIRDAGEARAPDEVSARVFAALDAEDRSGAAPTRPMRAKGGSRMLMPALGLVLVAAFALVVVLLRTPGQDPTRAAAADLARFAASTLVLDLETRDPQGLEQFFADGRIAFRTRVFDFGMMNFELAGGRVHEIDNRPSALFAYTSPLGRHIVCQMYEGGLSALPEDFERHILDEIEFRIFRRGDATLVFWQEGPLVCVLASDGDPDQALEFARAKARDAGT